MPYILSLYYNSLRPFSNNAHQRELRTENRINSAIIMFRIELENAINCYYAATIVTESFDKQWGGSL